MQLTLGVESSWSVRTYLCLLLARLNADIDCIDLASSHGRERLALISPTQSVPLLVANDLQVHDSLAIVEYFNELSSGALFPRDPALRAVARSLCAEIHSGFLGIR